MPIWNIVLILIVVGVVLHLINRYIPMASGIKTIEHCSDRRRLHLAMQATGLWASVTNFRLGM